MSKKKMLMRKFGSILPNIETNGLLFWLDSEIESSYSGSGTIWTDLIGGKNCDIIDGVYNGTTKTINFNAPDQYINVPSLTVTPNNGYTFTTFLKLPTFHNSGNPGFWRYIDGVNIGSFNILQYGAGLQRAPWIRSNNNEILKPTSGYVLPLSQYLMISFVVKSNDYANFYVNGVEKHTANHSIIQDSFIVNYLNYQLSTAENIFADYKSLLFYNRPLAATELLNNYNILSNFYTL